MTRSSRAFRLEFHAAFSRGYAPRVQTLSVASARCSNQEAMDPDLMLHVREIRTILAKRLAACGASRADTGAALRGPEPACDLILKWSWEGAEAAAAARAGDGGDQGMNMDHSCEDAAENWDLVDMNDVQAGGAC